jgi:transposase-like protein
MFLGDLDARGLKRPEFVLVDGAPGLEAALVALWGEAAYSGVMRPPIPI